MIRVPCTVYCVLCTVYRVPCTVYCVPCTVYRVPCTVYCVLWLWSTLQQLYTKTRELHGKVNKGTIDSFQNVSHIGTKKKYAEIAFSLFTRRRRRNRDAWFPRLWQRRQNHNKKHCQISYQCLIILWFIHILPSHRRPSGRYIHSTVPQDSHHFDATDTEATYLHSINISHRAEEN